MSISKVLTCLLLAQFNCLHFLLKEGSEKCLFDEIPKNQVVIGHYEIMDKLGEANDGVLVHVGI